MTERDSRPKILIVMHQAHSTPGRIGCYLSALGARLDIRRPSLGEPLPETLADHDGVVVFGGPMGANDDCEWIAPRDRLAGDAAARGQAAARHLPWRANARQNAWARGSSTMPTGAARSAIFRFAPDAGADDLCAAPFPAPCLSMALRRVRAARTARN